MPIKRERQQQGAVRSLSAGVVGPDPQRVAALKQWHIDQAISEAKPVAIINFTLTADGQITGRAIGLEPEHAKVMLPAIEEAAQQLRDQVGDQDTQAQPLRHITHGEAEPMRRKREFIQTHGSVCQHCDEALTPDQLHLFDFRSPAPGAQKRTLLCAPCHLSASATQAIAKPGIRLQVV
jgi:hypothetical protein